MQLNEDVGGSVDDAVQSFKDLVATTPADVDSANVSVLP